MNIPVVELVDSGIVEVIVEAVELVVDSVVVVYEVVALSDNFITPFNPV